MNVPVVSSSEISGAAHALKSGGLVVFPTETVYGFGADAENQNAINRIYQIKARPKSHPLIIHISNMTKFDYWTSNVPDYAFKLAQDFWPGPLTLILKKSKNSKNYATGGQATIGLRIPRHRVALDLIESFHELGGEGVAAPSANIFSEVSAISIETLSKQFIHRLDESNVSFIDGGESVIGIESTIVSCISFSPEILRPGFISKEQIEQSAGLKTGVRANRLRVSGNFKKRYSPLAKVVVNNTV